MEPNQNENSFLAKQASGVGMEIAKRAAYAGATRGAGAVPRVLAEQATKQTINSAARRAANRYMGKRGEAGADSSEAKKKKLTGIFFWLMICLAAVKDILDIVGDISVVLSWISILTGPFISFTILFYLYVNKINWDSRKVVTFIITAVIGIIPFLNLLPETTLNLILIRWFENSALAKKVMSKAAPVAKHI